LRADFDADEQLMSPFLPLRLLQTQSDARLVELASGGHERAFDVLVQRYRKPLLGYCRRLLLPEARAEDALQQALLQAWLALRDGSEVRDAKAWLYRIVHNAAISALRRSGYDYVELDESLHGARAAESDIDRRIAVREALAGLAALPEAQREVLLRTAVQGDTHEEVAAALGLSEGAVRGLVYRARATLRTAASALTPPQLVLWAAGATESGAGHSQIGEVVGGAGSASLFGFLLKGGAVVVSAGVLAAGATMVQHGGSSSSARADSSGNLSHQTHGPTGPGELRGVFGGESALAFIGDGPGPSAVGSHSSNDRGHGPESGSDHVHGGPDGSSGDGHDGTSSGSGTDGFGSGHDMAQGGGGGPGPNAGLGDHESGLESDGASGSGPISSASGSSGGAGGTPGDGGTSEGGSAQASSTEAPLPLEAEPPTDGGSSGSGAPTSGSKDGGGSSSESVEPAPSFAP
jgi:RNA polymerase sigma factor (sigma-70 family)